MLKCKPAELQSKTKLEREMKVSIEWILKSVNYSFPKTVDETSSFILTKLIQIFRRRMFLMKIENLRLLVFSRLDFFFSLWTRISSSIWKIANIFQWNKLFEIRRLSTFAYIFIIRPFIISRVVKHFVKNRISSFMEFGNNKRGILKFSKTYQWIKFVYTRLIFVLYYKL